MQNYAWMAVCCYLLIQGLTTKRVLAEAVPWLWWGVVLFAGIGVIVGFLPAIKSALGRIKVG